MPLTQSWLKRWRTDTSRSLGVPPYFVCTNKQIDALLADPPESCEELLARKGWTAKKFNHYGEAFAEFMGWDVDFPLPEIPKKRKPEIPKKQKPEIPKKRKPEIPKPKTNPNNENDRNPNPRF